MAITNGKGGVRPGLLLFGLLAGALFTLGLAVGLASVLGPRLAGLIPDVPIVTNAPEGMFDQSWFENGGSADAKGLSAAESRRSERVIRTALKEYPAPLLFSSLNEVHCVSELKIDGDEFFSTNQGDKVYILNRGSAKDPDETLERRPHYELASVLRWQASKHFNKASWYENLPDGFIYEPDREFQDWKEADFDLREEKWLSQGLLNIAGAWGVQDDFDEIAEGIMTGSLDFYSHVKKHPALNRKAKLVAAFYRRLGISLPLWEKEIEGKAGPKP